MATIIILAFISTLLYIRDKSTKINKSVSKIYLRHSVFFLLCFSIVFFQCDLDYVLGIIDASETYLWINPAVVCKSLALSNCALISFIFGASLYYKPLIVDVEYNYNIIKTNKEFVSYAIIVLLALYVFLVPKEYLKNGYELGLDDGRMSGLMSYLQACFIALYTLYSIDFKKQHQKSYFKYFKVPIIISVIYVFLIIITGRRTESVRIASLLLISFLYSQKESVNYRRILLGAVLGIVILSIIGVLRSYSSGDIVESLYLISNNQSVSPFTREYAGSVNTLHIALDNYPSKLNFNYGSTFLPGFLKIVPGLTDFYASYFAVPPLRTSGDIFTSLYFDGEKYWGLGSSIVADIYISFAAVGVCIVMMLFGYFIKYLEYVTFITQKSPYILALSFSAYSAFLFSCRSSMSVIFLCWTYSCIMIYLVIRKRKT